MRTSYISGGGLGLIEYPDEIVFANMPQRVNLYSFPTTSVQVNVRGVGTFTWSTFNRAAEINLSAFLVAAFGDMRNISASDAAKRSRNIHVTIYDANNVERFAFDVCAIWGALEPFERTAFYGAYAFDPDNQQWQRTVRWFANYPQPLETIAGAGGSWYISKDSGPYGSPTTISEAGIVQIDPAAQFAGMNTRGEWLVEVTPNDVNVFDQTFDATFTNIIALFQQIITVIKDTRKCGYFLRWIDRQGLLQAYLFAKGTQSTKAGDGEAVEVETLRAGLYYGGITRRERQGLEKSLKICATLVPEEEARFVQSIGTAAVCDLYVGNDDLGNEIWLPVNVKAGTLTISERGGLQDIEVTVELPTAEPQKF